MPLLNKSENEARVVPSAVVTAATGKTGGFSAERSHAREFSRAAAAAVEEAPRTLANREGQRMAACFAADSEIMARCAPLGSMRLDPAASSAGMRQQVRELVPQRAINFGGAMFPQAWVQ